MVLPDRDSQHLNNALDATPVHSPYDTTGPAGDLVNVFHRLQAMNAQTTADTTLKSDIWREMMSTISALPQPSAAAANRLPGAGSHIIPFRDRITTRRSQIPILHRAIALGLLLAIAFGLIGYQQYGPGKNGPTIPAPMAAQAVYQGPDISKCTTEARAPGSVERLASEEATAPAFFPRYGEAPDRPLGPPDPSEIVVPGETVLSQTKPVTDLDPAIYALLEQLQDCSPYLLINSNTFGVDGRYFALFSDDFFRRELAGFLQAGMEIRLVQVWSPNGTMPEIIAARSLGDRIVIILNRPSPKLMGAYSALILANGRDGWRVDEVGFVGPAEGIEPTATPVAATASPVAGLRYSERLEVGYLLFDESMAGPPPSPSNVKTICDALPGGKDVVCGWNYNRIGPWGYNEYPANTDFTFALSNVSSTALRFEVKALGITVMVNPNETMPFVINAAPGDYLFEIYEGSSPTPFSGGVLTFNGPGDRYSMG